jgi:hypothetical protein
MRTTTKRLTGLAIALSLSGFGLFAVPAAAATAHTAIPLAAAHRPVKVSAKPDKTHLRVGEHVKIRGQLDTLTAGNGTAAPMASADLEPVVVQELEGGTWVNLETDFCQPDEDFAIDVSFDISAALTLRVYHPDTDAFDAGFSDTFNLFVGL